MLSFLLSFGAVGCVVSGFSMMVDLGERLYFAAGSDRNIKLTTKDDLELFKAMLNQEKAKGE